MNTSRLTIICILCSFLVLFSLSTHATSAESQHYKKTLENYTVPAVTLVDHEGQMVDLQSYLNDDKPVVLDFIYATCTTICPILSVGFAHFQKKLGDKAEEVRIVSISIDPDNDTPELLKEHLQKYGARPGWAALTGKRDSVVSVLKEFDAYVVNKMNHYPLTIMHAPGEDKWVRLYGMLSAADLKKEYILLTQQ